MKKKIKALLDTGASISMIRQKDLLELGFRCKDLKPADLRVVQADGRGNKNIWYDMSASDGSRGGNYANIICSNHPL